MNSGLLYPPLPPTLPHTYDFILQPPLCIWISHPLSLPLQIPSLVDNGGTPLTLSSLFAGAMAELARRPLARSCAEHSAAVLIISEVVLGSATAMLRLGRRLDKGSARPRRTSAGRGQDHESSQLQDVSPRAALRATLGLDSHVGVLHARNLLL